MPALSKARLAALLEPFLHASAEEGCADGPAIAGDELLLPALSRYLDLLLAWNARTNLSAIRDPEEIVRRHFGESLFAARRLELLLKKEASVLDLGSGAGFPGLPLSLLLPAVRVTLAESQHKKAAFLREAARITGSQATVWGGRSEELPPAGFDAVTLRAVDRMGRALAEARRLVRPGGTILWFGACPASLGELAWAPLPQRTDSGVLIETLP